jgi:hypothetical protein
MPKGWGEQYMRTLLIILFLMSISLNVSAIEPINDQQVMLYYHIPLGGDKQQSKHQFGLRFDNTSHDPRDVVQISTLETRPAAFDFRMGYDGVESIKIHGVDYAAYLIAKAAEGEDSPVDTEVEATTTEEATTDEPAAAETAPAETTPAETTEAPAEKGPIQKKLDELPFGVVIGVILGIGIIAGVGG